MSGLSEHLFWDVDRREITADSHPRWLVKRVLEYGEWSDWQFLVDRYGRGKLAGIATGIRSLNPRALAFCRAWFQLPDSAFRCSTRPRFP